MDLANVVYSIAGFLAIYYFHDMAKSIKDAVKSIDDLNMKVGIVVERTETHSNEIEILRNKQDNLVADVAHIKAHIDVR